VGGVVRQLAGPPAALTMWGFITAIDDWLHAHSRLIAGISIAAFVLSCAQYAGFVRLPEFWHLPAAIAWLVPALRYGAWEAFVTPTLRTRRAALEGQTHD
jgi:hypothetical protein